MLAFPFIHDCNEGGFNRETFYEVSKIKPTITVENENNIDNTLISLLKYTYTKEKYGLLLDC